MAGQSRGPDRGDATVLGLSNADAARKSINLAIQQAEALYRSGKSAEAAELLAQLEPEVPDHQLQVRLSILRGMALFDAGEVVASIEGLRNAVEVSCQGDNRTRFSAALSLFREGIGFSRARRTSARPRSAPSVRLPRGRCGRSCQSALSSGTG